MREFALQDRKSGLTLNVAITGFIAGVAAGELKVMPVLDHKDTIDSINAQISDLHHYNQDIHNIKAHLPGISASTPNAIEALDKTVHLNRLNIGKLNHQKPEPISDAAEVGIVGGLGVAGTVAAVGLLKATQGAYRLVRNKLSSDESE
jgi:hypothetical protein